MEEGKLHNKLFEASLRKGLRILAGQGNKDGRDFALCNDTNRIGKKTERQWISSYRGCCWRVISRNQR